MKFKTVAGDSDRCSGIVFNVKPNGDWLAIRYNDTENNIVLWEFHNGIRRSVKRGPERTWMLDRAAWHELKMTVDGADFKAWIDGKLALEYTLGSAPGPGRNNAAPNPELFPDNNPVLRPPVGGPGRPVVEDRQHQLLQGLRRQSQVAGRRATATLSPAREGRISRYALAMPDTIPKTARPHAAPAARPAASVRF